MSQCCQGHDPHERLLTTHGLAVEALRRLEGQLRVLHDGIVQLQEEAGRPNCCPMCGGPPRRIGELRRKCREVSATE